jgi:membrane-associated protease RseP (regulator of RpoE activity)
MVNLSLFLFNLIPLGSLDGKYFLHSMLGETSTDEVYNLDALERGETPDHGGCGALESAICRGAGVLVALDSVLIVLALVRI